MGLPIRPNSDVKENVLKRPITKWTTQKILLLLLAIVLLLSKGASAIGCFVCSSLNGSDPNCDDAFNTSTHVVDKMPSGDGDGQWAAVKIRYYQNPCFGYKKGRNGLFPADHCIKIEGKASDEKSNITIRTCALDSGSLTADTELVRISHCGHFYYNDIYYSGCVQSCDTQGCNGAEQFPATVSILLLTTVATVFMFALKL